MKKLFIFLSAVVLTTSMSLMAMSPENPSVGQMDVDGVQQAMQDAEQDPESAANQVQDVEGGRKRAHPEDEQNPGEPARKKSRTSQDTVDQKTEMNDLSDDIVHEIIGHLSDDIHSGCALSLASHRYFYLTRDLRLSAIEWCHGLGRRSVNELDITSLYDYKEAVVKWRDLVEKRKKPGCFKFQQQEFTALQDFIIDSLENEFEKPMDQINLQEYVFVPLALNNEFRNIAKSTSGETLLHIVALGGHFQLIKEFVRRGYGVNVRNTKGETPLLKTMLTQNFRMAQELIAAGADVNIADAEDGITPMHYLVENGDLESFRVVMASNPDLNKMDIYGDTPLHHAAMGENLEIIRDILNTGFDVNKKARDGKTALHIAVSKGNGRLLNVLIHEYHADLNIPDEEGYTPLHTAVEDGSMQMVLILSGAGANLNARINATASKFGGFTALEIARAKRVYEDGDSGGSDENVYQKIVQILVDEQDIRNRVQRKVTDYFDGTIRK